MNPMAEMAILTLLFAAVMLLAAVVFDGSHVRREQLWTAGLLSTLWIESELTVSRNPANACIFVSHLRLSLGASLIEQASRTSCHDWYNGIRKREEL
jgi:hypothetical protein